MARALAQQTIMPAPMAAGVFGMQRMIGVTPGSMTASVAIVVPAAIETKVVGPPASPA